MMMMMMVMMMMMMMVMMMMVMMMMMMMMKFLNEDSVFSTSLQNAFCIQDFCSFSTV